MEWLHQTTAWLNSVLSDYVLTALLIGCGVFFSIRTRFVQFRCFGEGIRNALVGISTVYTGNGPLAHATGSTYKAMLASSGLAPTNLMQYAISSVSSRPIGNAFIAVCLFFFASSTVIVWSMFGKINCTYLWGKRAATVYSVIAVALIFCGTLMKSDLVWELQDLLNQLMVLPNVLALVALAGIVAAAAHRN